MHKFAQKFKFKGPWDATGKIIKEAIRNCELQFKRCANAMDCYENMTERLAHDGNGKLQKQWKKWETEKDKQILTKTFFKTNRTFIGLGVESKEKYDELIALKKKHIVFTDRENIPDMKAIPGTLKVYQAAGNKSGEKTLTTSERQCSCPQCRFNPENLDTCIYKEERGEIKTHVVKVIDEKEKESEQDDPHGIKSLKVQELKDELRARGLPISGVKAVLIERLTASLNKDHTVVNYETLESEEYAGGGDNINY